ncbi:MAG: iron chelate uptake ABC transporter family permease subunit [Streptosporangiales bacterium]|nr:iron chelate uptake ABC transporter family permease subunit [Streptosporangiales bacterium]
MTASAFPADRRRRRAVLAALAASVPAALLAATIAGSVSVPPADVLHVLTGGAASDPRWQVVIETVRLPRAVTAALAGAALATAGVQMQALFRNVLADPYVLGVSSGASLGVALLMLASGGAGGAFAAGLASFVDLVGLGRLGMVLAAALGAAAVLAFILVLARWVRSAVTLLLIGVMVGYLTTALVSVLLATADPRWAQQYIAWGLGSFGATPWPDLAVLAPVVGAGLAIALLSAKHLNALLLGEDYARTMGIRVRRVRLGTMLAASLLAGSVTAFCGPIGFLGLAVPHLARSALGTSDHRVLLPAAVLLGAAVALGCGAVAEVRALPLNAVTALLGAPVVVAVLVRGSRAGGAGGALR